MINQQTGTGLSVSIDRLQKAIILLEDRLVHLQTRSGLGHAPVDQDYMDLRADLALLKKREQEVTDAARLAHEAMRQASLKMRELLETNKD